MATKAVLKQDPNTEAFQMRAQWKKTDNCRLLWKERWGWLLEENKLLLKENQALRREAAAILPLAVARVESDKSLKPIPCTSTGFIGWISSRPDCQLEIYTSWLNKPPVRAPDVWDNKDYVGSSTTTTTH